MLRVLCGNRTAENLSDEDVSCIRENGEVLFVRHSSYYGNIAGRSNFVDVCVLAVHILFAEGNDGVRVRIQNGDYSLT